jgi:hypothetical protein
MYVEATSPIPTAVGSSAEAEMLTAAAQRQRAALLKQWEAEDIEDEKRRQDHAAEMARLHRERSDAQQVSNQWNALRSEHKVSLSVAYSLGIQNTELGRALIEFGRVLGDSRLHTVGMPVGWEPTK